MNRIVISLLSISLFFMACKKEDPVPVDDNSNNPSYIIEVTVTHIYNTTTGADSLMQGANVQIYTSDADRTNGVNVFKSGSTNASGIYTTSTSELGEYYLLISAQGVSNSALEQVSVTKNTAKAIVNTSLY